MSMTRLTEPARSACTARLPSGSPVKPITALLARVCPMLKLIVDVCAAKPEGPNRRSPLAAGPTTVTLASTARELAGTPHWPVITKRRLAPPPARDGPPVGPAGWRGAAARAGGAVGN